MRGRGGAPRWAGSCRAGLLLVPLLLVAGPGRGVAEEPLANLLARLGPATGRAGTVTLSTRIEQGEAGGRALVVRLAPDGDARLVGDPGITLSPVARPDVAWRSAPVRRVDEGAQYFAGPQELRLPFTARTTGTVEADVSYAYCILHEQCRLGEARVRAELTAAPQG